MHFWVGQFRAKKVGQFGAKRVGQFETKRVGQFERFFHLMKEDLINHVRELVEDIRYKSIMVDVFEQLSFQQETIEYAELVSSGQLYDFLNEKVVEYYGDPLERKSVKIGLLKGFFVDNRIAPTLLVMDLFKEQFPLIYRLIALIKKAGKDQFAHILQQLECVIFLHRIAKRIRKELPKVPFYTVHDNIITTVTNMTDVKAIMNEELQKAVGIEPTFGFETLKIKND